MEGLVVEVGAGGDAARAQELAVRLGVPVGTSAAVGGLCLLVGEKGLSLEGDGMSLAADLSRMVPRLRAGNLNRELVVRAARIRGAAGPLTAVDATAGMGEDSLLLAAAGFSVTLFERDPVESARFWATPWHVRRRTRRWRTRGLTHGASRRGLRAGASRAGLLA